MRLVIELDSLLLNVPGDTAYEPTPAEWRLLDRLGRSPDDHEAMSAAHVLARIPFARIADSIDRASIDFDSLLAAPWSSGERVLVGVAAALWAGYEETAVADVVRSLDDDNLSAVLEAIVLRRGWWIGNVAPSAAARVER